METSIRGLSFPSIINLYVLQPAESTSIIFVCPFPVSPRCSSHRSTSENRPLELPSAGILISANEAQTSRPLSASWGLENRAFNQRRSSQIRFSTCIALPRLFLLDFLLKHPAGRFFTQARLINENPFLLLQTVPRNCATSTFNELCMFDFFLYSSLIQVTNVTWNRGIF